MAFLTLHEMLPLAFDYAGQKQAVKAVFVGMAFMSARFVTTQLEKCRIILSVSWISCGHILLIVLGELHHWLLNVPQLLTQTHS